MDKISGLAQHFRTALRGSPLYAPIRKFRLEQLTRKPGAYPDWERLLAPMDDEWLEAVAAAEGRQRVLIATSLGLHFTANAIDSLIAVALTLRGAKVDILLCDGVLPACQVVDHVLAPSIDRYAESGPKADFCATCGKAGLRNFSPLGLSVRKLSQTLNIEDYETAKDEASQMARQSLNPVEARGWVEHGYAGALRFFGRTLLPDTSQALAVFERYLAAAKLSQLASERLIEREQYDVVVAHHGIYAPQGPIADAARDKGAKLVTWHPSYRKGRLIYEHGDTYHRAMISEPKTRWAEKKLSSEEEASLDTYLQSRTVGSQDWITFQRSEPQSRIALENALGLEFDKPTMILIGNVAWDARLHYENSAYGDMTQWAVDTVRWFAQNPDRQLIVRCHPGEVMSSPRAQDRLDDVLKAAFPELPPNVVIVSPENELNTYALAKECCAALIYNTKMGVELAARGMPVVVAGDAWIRGKGLSEDATDANSYFAILDRAHGLSPLEGDSLALARRYAFHFFFRRCVPVGLFDENQGWPLCALSDKAGLKAKPGGDAGLDLICDGILNGTPFEYEGPENSILVEPSQAV